MKIVECVGKPLSKVFSKNFGDGRCNRVNCQPCQNVSKKGPTLCKVKSVVYESNCEICKSEYTKDRSQQHRGKYVEQTLRTLFEHANEHVEALEGFDLDSFVFKHWATAHNMLNLPPKFNFTVIKSHKDPLSRLIHESVRITSHATMNSRTEWNGYKVSRIIVEASDKETRDRLDDLDKGDKKKVNMMLNLKSRVEQLSQRTNLSNNYRQSKRTRQVMSDKAEVSSLMKGSKCEIPKKSHAVNDGGKARNVKEAKEGDNVLVKWLKNVKSSTPIRPNDAAKVVSVERVRPSDNVEKTCETVDVNRENSGSNFSNDGFGFIGELVA